MTRSISPPAEKENNITYSSSHFNQKRAGSVSKASVIAEPGRVHRPESCNRSRVLQNKQYKVTKHYCSIWLLQSRYLINSHPPCCDRMCLVRLSLRVDPRPDPTENLHPSNRQKNTDSEASLRCFALTWRLRSFLYRKASVQPSTSHGNGGKCFLRCVL